MKRSLFGPQNMAAFFKFLSCFKKKSVIYQIQCCQYLSLSYTVMWLYGLSMIISISVDLTIIYHPPLYHL